MPRIEEYSPESETQGPVGGIDPGVDAQTAPYRAIESGLSEINQSVQRGEEIRKQEEVSNAFDSFADLRVQKNEQLNNAIANNEPIDVDKFTQDYNDQVAQMRDQYNTNGGKDYFDRQAARTGAALTQHAIAGQAVVAGQTAKMQYQSAMNNNVALIQQNPGAYDSVKASTDDFIDSYIVANPKLASQRAALTQANTDNLATAAIRGLADKNPDLAEQMFNQGHYRDDMSPAAQYAAERYIKQAQSAADAQESVSDRAAQRAQKAAGEAWLSSRMDHIVDGTLPVKDLVNAGQIGPNGEPPVLTPEQVNMWTKQVMEYAKAGKNASDPHQLNTVYNQIESGKITDFNQVLPLLKTDGTGISLSDGKKIQHEIQMLPQAQSDRANRAALLQQAQAELVKASPIAGIKDPDGIANLNTFRQALQKAEAENAKQGLPNSALYDINSPTYFGKQLVNYRKTPQQIMQSNLNQMMPPASTQQLQQLAPLSTPTPTTKPPITLRLPGETPAQYLKRIGK